MITEKYVKTSISLAPHLMSKVDAYADELGINRSNAMAILIKQAFDYQEQMKTISDFTKQMPTMVEEMKKIEGKLSRNAKK
jgi:metal-responsive CopG/Arc/MetJ family transcriptional regulator